MGVVFWFCSYGCFIRISQHFKIIQVQLTPSWFVCLSSVQFSRSNMSNSLWPHELQHASPPCPSPPPGAYPNSCPLSRWCCPTVSSSVIPFSFRLQSFPASGSFPMSQFFAWGGQSIGVSALGSVLPMNVQDWFPLGWTGWISLQSRGLSRVFSNTTVQKNVYLKVNCGFNAEKLSFRTLRLSKVFSVGILWISHKFIFFPAFCSSDKIWNGNALVTNFLPSCLTDSFYSSQHFQVTPCISRSVLLSPANTPGAPRLGSHTRPAAPPHLRATLQPPPHLNELFLNFPQPHLSLLLHSTHSFYFLSILDLHAYLAYLCACVLSRSVVSNSLWPHGL